jgi:hypothetical protein
MGRQNPLGATTFRTSAGNQTQPELDASGNLPVVLEEGAAVTVNPTGLPYVAVAASQTNAALGAAGAIGDYLEGFLIIPAVAACGAVTIKDNTTAVISFPGGGTTALPTLAPIWVPVGAYSALGGWTVTTGASVSVLAVGKFA